MGLSLPSSSSSGDARKGRRSGDGRDSELLLTTSMLDAGWDIAEGCTDGDCWASFQYAIATVSDVLSRTYASTLLPDVL